MQNRDIDEIKHEYRTIHQQFVVVLVSVIALVSFGATIYRHLLHLTWVNAFYFCTVTLTTVGYGDITPTTNASKIFTIFYIVVGIGIVAAFANLMIKNSLLKRELRVSKRREKKQQKKNN